MLNFGALVILCLCIPKYLSLSEEMMELARQLHEDCQGETGVEEAMIDEVKEKRGFPNDEKLKCYMKCLMMAMAVVDDDGMLDVEAAIAILPDDLREFAEPVMRKCGTKTGANPCDSVYLTHQCYYNADPEHYFIV